MPGKESIPQAAASCEILSTINGLRYLHLMCALTNIIAAGRGGEAC